MFDKIILDMPCSGLGVLRKKPEKIYELTANDIKKFKETSEKKYLKVHINL